MSLQRLTRLTGFLRSLAIYHGRPGRLKRETAFLGSLIHAGDLCFDVGAHAGNRTRSLAHLGAQVIALEPQPLFARFLAWFFRHQGSVTILPWAVGADSGEVKLNISPRTPTTTTVSRDFVKVAARTEGFQQVRWTEHLIVPQTTLDQLIARHGQPRYCKIDVEGYEAEVLEGLSVPLTIISIEYLGQNPQPAIKALTRLQELGDYRYNASPGESMKFHFPEWRSAKEMSDWLEAGAEGQPFGDIYAVRANETDLLDRLQKVA
ncbi:MAG: FkbM family methyltransferase [Pseudomonadota bacterium]|uniref:FkbM family methyltransferase n=1 Tax=Fodinicurvata fenggangensis TaxID=1121830 RepID=UPI00138E3324|nr:FkbM family methyltransferase [Fodinicurvata fenggangensis]